METEETQKAMRAWYVGLPCRQCGTLVKQNDGGLFVHPVDEESWAECQNCREKKGEDDR